MRRGLIFLLGLLLLGILTYFCFQDKADGIKHRLENQANDILSNYELDNAKAKLIGSGFETTTIMKLTGEVPSAEIKDSVSKQIGSISGITDVKNELSITTVKVPEILPVEPKEPEVVNEVEEVKITTPSPYLFDASKDESGSITLNGYVENNDSHQAILDKAIDIFGKDNVIDEIKVAKGAPKNWNNIIYIGLEKLKDVEHGTLNLLDQNYAFNGYISYDNAKDLRSEILRDSKEQMKQYSDYVGNFEIKIPEVKVIKKGIRECQRSLMDISSKEKILFEYGSADIKKDNTKVLDRIVKTLKECDFDKIKSIEIAGHTDSIGSYETNQKLSQKRADNVKGYLIEHGIDKDKLLSKGYGERKPLVSNMLKAGRAKNRRIEFIIKGER